jgi:exopolysaccharide biosynthesis predicted pyruvyltransferase EpsI
MPTPALPFAARLADYRDLLVHDLRNGDLRGRAPLRLLTEMHGNIGDHLIWSGTEALLAAADTPFERLSMSDVAAGWFRDECLVVPGSGALTRVWHEWLPELIVEASRRFRFVLIMPSQYDTSVDVVANALARPNVFAYARDAASYRAARPLGRTSLAFDPALFCPLLGTERSSANEPHMPHRRLVTFREDRASRLAELGYAVNPAVNRDIGSTAHDLGDFVAAVRGVDEVVTDRLHVAVTAVMCGKRLAYFDPHERKISAYFAFTFRDAFAETTRACSLAELVEMGCVLRL